MIETIIQRSPALAAIIAVIAVIFILLLIGAVMPGRRRRRRAEAYAETYPARREPDFYRDDPPEEHGYYPVYQPAPAPTARPQRRGFGLAAVILAFLLGLGTGTVAMLTARAEIGEMLSRLADALRTQPEQPSSTAAPAPPVATPAVQAATDIAPEPTAAPPPPAAATPTPAPAPEPTITPAADVGPRLEAFAANLREGLTGREGQELALETVAVEDRTVRLGYKLNRILALEETQPFRDHVTRSVTSLFCARESSEVRYLSQNGVVFELAYTDASGVTVSEITVTPSYCD